MRPIRFKFSAEKARAAIHWMIAEQQDIDLHTMMKSCYFGDKDHLNRHDRPIFGATYRAMRFGPVPLEIYEMAKGEAIWLAELGASAYPWTISNGYKLRLVSNESADLSVLSETDLLSLKVGFDLSRSMNFNQRTIATHGNDWQNAQLGLMRYEDMIDESPQKAEKVAYLRDAAHFIRL